MPLLIQSATLVDGTGGAPISDGAVLVSGTTIVAAGRRNEVREHAASGTQVIDAGGGAILPDLINCHDGPVAELTPADSPSRQGDRERARSHLGRPKCQRSRSQLVPVSDPVAKN